MLSVPLLEGATFWILLRKSNQVQDSKPQVKQSANDEESSIVNKEIKLKLAEKIRYIPSLFKYMIPLILVFLFEYFINQGLVSMQ